MNLSLIYPTQFAEAERYFVSKYPNEAMGYISNKGDFVPLENDSLYPDSHAVHYDFSPKQYIETVIFLHSHPNRDETPSPFDLRHQKRWRKPWGILSIKEGKKDKWHIWGDDK